MTKALWPLSLPQEAKLAEVEQELGEQTVRSAVDVGPALVRQRISTGIDTFPIALWLTATQYLEFIEFYRTSIGGGALAFQWKNPLTGNPADLRITSKPRLKPMSSRTAPSLHFRCSFSVEIMPGTEVIGGGPPPAPSHPPGGGDFLRFGIGAADGENAEASADVSDGDASSVFHEVFREADAAEPSILLTVLAGFGSGFDDGTGDDAPDLEQPFGGSFGTEGGGATDTWNQSGFPLGSGSV